MRKTIAVAAALSITLGACSSHSSPKPEASPDVSARIDRIRSQGVNGTTVFASFLKPVGDCDALLAHIHAEAAARVGPYGLPGYGNRFGDEVTFAATGATAAASDGAKSAAAAPPGREGTADGGSSTPFSGTNNQEDGVDEPDIVKTDGRRIVTLTRNRLNVVEVNGGTSGAVRTVAVGDDTFTPSEVLILGDRALIFGTGYDPNSGGGISGSGDSGSAASSTPKVL